MKNLDSIREKIKNASNGILDAVKSGNEENITQAFSAYNDLITEINESDRLNDIQAQLDNSILTARGVRRITSEERQYAEAFITAATSETPVQALVDVPKAMPQTIIDTVIEDIKTEHPLLNAIDFQSSEYNIRRLYSEDGVTEAVWGTITAAIATELSKTIKSIDATHNKLSAFLPVPKGYLNYSPEWLITLITTMLTESLGAGMEKAIICGTGKNEPIGMIKDLGGAVTGGVYPDKATVALNELTAEAYCEAVAKVAVRPDGKSRNLTEVLFVCNPIDYLKKVCPATTVLTSDGTYRNNVFPFPTRVITSEYVPAGKAIIGIANRYIGLLGTSQQGSIEYNDSVQFLEDNRVYIIKAYGNGTPKDNTSFAYLDISQLKPHEWKVQMVESKTSAE